MNIPSDPLWSPYDDMDYEALVMARFQNDDKEADDYYESLGEDE